MQNENQEVATAEAIDLVSKLLVFDHKLRPSAKMAMQHEYFQRMSGPRLEAPKVLRNSIQ